MNQASFNKRKGELVIDFKEYFWRLLEQWKAILIFALIVILLISGATYTRTDSTDIAEGNDLPEVSQTAEDILDALSPDDQEFVLSAVEEKKSLDDIRDYVSTSPFMSLDPNRVNTLTMSLLIRSEEKINKTLSAAYSLELTSSHIASAVNEAWGNAYSNEQVRELISAVSGIPLESDYRLEGDIIRLSVFIPDEMDPKLAEGAIKSSLSGIKDKLSDSFGDHTLKVISSDVQIISDKDFSERQYDIYTRLYNLTYHSVYLTGLMSAEQKDAYNALISGIEENSEEEEQPEAVPSNGFFRKKIVIIGFVFACFTYAFIYLLVFALRNRVSSASFLESVFNLRVLSEWHPDNKKGIAGILFNDSRVSKLHHKGHLSNDSEMAKAGESIAFAVKEKEKGNVLIVSSENAGEDAKTFLNSLEGYLGEKGITATVSEIDGLKGVAVTEKTISNNDACVIIVDGEKTIKGDIENAINKCAYCDVPLIGAVYVG